MTQINSHNKRKFQYPREISGAGETLPKRWAIIRLTRCSSELVSDEAGPRVAKTCRSVRARLAQRNFYNSDGSKRFSNLLESVGYQLVVLRRFSKFFCRPQSLKFVVVFRSRAIGSCLTSPNTRRMFTLGKTNAMGHLSWALMELNFEHCQTVRSKKLYKIRNK